MRLAKLVLAGIAAFSLLTVLQPNASGAHSLAAIAIARGVDSAVGSAPEGVVIPVFHSGRSTSFYCYPRNYWWFYRPYVTAGQDYGRCMPYFHYPPEAYKGRVGGAGLK
jgi:hypothetical protein